MILQALKEYYDRKPDLPPQGWETIEFQYLVLLNPQGGFVGFKDTREGTPPSPKTFLVPSLGEKKGNGIKSNLFWENIEYLFGIPVQSEGRHSNHERVKKQHQEFMRRIEAIQGKCATLTIVRNFLKQIDIEAIQKSKDWDNVLELNRPLLFGIVNQEGPVTDDSELRHLIKLSHPPEKDKGRCLVTGENDEIISLEPPIRGVRGANPTGASLVSINNKINNGINAGAVPAFASFLKEQGQNSPIGKAASFAYTTALNDLLKKKSPQKIRLGDATAVFWSAKESAFEKNAALYFDEPPKDDPDRNTEAVKALYDSIWNGAYSPPDEETRFYVLGLSPNSARIAVRFWHVATIKEMGERLKLHVEDLSISHKNWESSALPLQKLLRSIAPQEDYDNIPPNLAGETMRSILEGIPYPATLLQGAIRRVRAEQSAKYNGKPKPHITYERAAIIKACLNRALRFNKNSHEKEITMSLDAGNVNVGYRLGRLFATLEKTQSEAQGTTNSTIRDRYYGSASSTPRTVFGNLMRLSKHHLSKLEKEKTGLYILRKQLIGEIIDGITDFPPYLNIADQGRFAIGYYHQMQKLWSGRADTKNN
jgi:CRISPR-associated protein Csd1